LSGVFSCVLITILFSPFSVYKTGKKNFVIMLPAFVKEVQGGLATGGGGKHTPWFFHFKMFLSH
jgi:hypothetical protein